MARLAARWRRSNLVILVTFKKKTIWVKHTSKRAQEKLYTEERDPLEVSHAETYIQRTVLKRKKNLAFSEDTHLEKERLQSKMTPRKVRVELKRRGK